MLELRDVSFAYRDSSGAELSGASLRVAPGECVALTGRSGCGKTTLLRCVNGLAGGFYEGRLAGEVSIAGKSVSGLPFHGLAPLVGSVFQDPRSQFFSSDCLSEICFACENLGLGASETRSRAAEAVDAVGISRLLGRSVFEMSGGERQLVAIASVRAARPLAYALDEPSANLDGQAARKVAEVMATLKAEGAAIVVAEHKLWYLRDVVDRIVVVDGGRIAGDYPKSAFLGWGGAEYRRLGLRSLFPERDGPEGPRQLAAEPLDGSSAPPPKASPGSVQADAVAKVRKASRVLDGASVRLERGSVTALVGPNGAGKSTLARVLCGLERPDSGRLYLDGRRIGRSALAAQAYYFLQDCDYQLFSDAVGKEPLLGLRPDPGNRAKAESLLRGLGLWELRDRHPASLSRGQKQRLGAACAMMRRPSLLALDEPTSGLDSGSMEILGGLVRRAASEGAAVLAITHDYEFARDFADAAIVMDSGRAVDAFPLDVDGVRKLKGHFFKPETNDTKENP